MKRFLVCLTLLALVAGSAYAQTPVTPAPAQPVSVNVVAVYTITVTPASVTFADFQRPIADCRTDASTVVTVTSSDAWSLSVETDLAHSDGRLRNGSTPMGTALQVAGGATPLTNISNSPLFLLSAQAPTASQATPTNYKLCSLAADAVGTYSIPVIYTLRP